MNDNFNYKNRILLQFIFEWGKGNDKKQDKELNTFVDWLYKDKLSFKLKIKWKY